MKSENLQHKLLALFYTHTIVTGTNVLAYTYMDKVCNLHTGGVEVGEQENKSCDPFICALPLERIMIKRLRNGCKISL